MGKTPKGTPAARSGSPETISGSPPRRPPVQHSPRPGDQNVDRPRSRGRGMVQQPTRSRERGRSPTIRSTINSPSGKIPVVVLEDVLDANAGHTPSRIAAGRTPRGKSVQGDRTPLDLQGTGLSQKQRDFFQGAVAKSHNHIMEVFEARVIKLLVDSDQTLELRSNAILKLVQEYDTKFREKLDALAKRLDDEVSERAKIFNLCVDNLQEIDKLKESLSQVKTLNVSLTEQLQTFYLEIQEKLGKPDIPGGSQSSSSDEEFEVDVSNELSECEANTEHDHRKKVLVTRPNDGDWTFCGMDKPEPTGSKKSPPEPTGGREESERLGTDVHDRAGRSAPVRHSAGTGKNEAEDAEKEARSLVKTMHKTFGLLLKGQSVSLAEREHTDKCLERLVQLNRKYKATSSDDPVCLPACDYTDKTGGEAHSSQQPAGPAPSTGDADGYVRPAGKLKHESHSDEVVQGKGKALPTCTNNRLRSGSCAHANQAPVAPGNVSLQLQQAAEQSTQSLQNSQPARDVKQDQIRLRSLLSGEIRRLSLQTQQAVSDSDLGKARKYVNQITEKHTIYKSHADKLSALYSFDESLEAFKESDAVNDSVYDAKELVRSKTEIAKNSNKLPKLELPTFDGAILKWQTWWNAYDHSVHSNVDLNEATKWMHLRKVLTGPAHDAIESFESTVEGYHEAIKALKERFGDKIRIKNSHIDALGRLPVCRSENLAKDARTLIDKIRFHTAALKTLGVAREQYEDMVANKIMLECLPADRSADWFERYGANLTFENVMTQLDKTVQALERAHSTRQDRQVSLVKELQQQAVSVHAVVASKSKTKGTEDKKSKSRDVDKCNVCDGQHKARKCNHKDSRVRANLAKSRKLCMKCLSGRHKTTDCSSKQTCSRCNKEGHCATICFANLNGDSSSQEDAEVVTGTTVAVVETVTASASSPI